MLYCPFVGGPSAAFAAQISNETGSGALAFATSPTFVTPVLGTPSSGTLSSCTAATDSTAGVMSAADHTTLTSLSGSASGVAPTAPAGVLCLGNATGLDFKTANQTLDIFTVPVGKTFAAVMAWIIPTTVVGGAAVTFGYRIVESGAAGQMTQNTVATSAAPATTKSWVQNALAPANAPYLLCAAGNKVQFKTGANSFSTSTTVTGTCWVLGFYF